MTTHKEAQCSHTADDVCESRCKVRIGMMRCSGICCCCLCCDGSHMCYDHLVKSLNGKLIKKKDRYVELCV